MRLSRKNPVPADIALLYEFVNSLDLRRFVQDGVPHEGGDELATPAQLEVWMRRRGSLGKGMVINSDGYRKALELRRSLRALLQLSQSDRRRDADAVARVNDAAANFPLIVHISDGESRLRPLSGLRSCGLGKVLAELQHAAETGKLDRLKMCAAEECRWVFFDRSKPGTRRWCASTLCGNREKTRAYRDRQRANGTAADDAR